MFGFMPGGPSETPQHTEMVTADRFSGGAGSENSLFQFALRILLIIGTMAALAVGLLYLLDTAG